MAITHKQLVELGFTPDISREGSPLTFTMEHGNVFFWVSKDKLYCKTTEYKEGQEFIYLEYLSLKALKLFMSRTVQNYISWRTNQNYLHSLVHGRNTTS